MKEVYLIERIDMSNVDDRDFFADKSGGDPKEFKNRDAAQRYLVKCKSEDKLSDDYYYIVTQTFVIG